MGLFSKAVEPQPEKKTRAKRTTKPIKVFEALIGTEWKSWKATDDSSITRTGCVLSIVSKVASDNFTGELRTDFDLSKLIAYSIGV